jgi:hypothetical protein
VRLPQDAGTCCAGLDIVTGEDGYSYCGTDACIADGVGCADAGGKPCCNLQCNGESCSGV